MLLLYAYDFSDFANGKVAPDRLEYEIDQSNVIVRALDHVSTVGTTCKIWFKASLDPTEQADLDAIVAAHEGTPLAGRPTDKEGIPLVSLDVPREEDKKLVVVTSPSTEGWMTFFTGADDDTSPTPPASGRGTGTRIRISYAAEETGTKAVDLQFKEPVEVHDGGGWYNGFGMDDLINFSVVMPATAIVSNGTNTGNCNLVPMAPGGPPMVIVPAAGNGAYDVDLATAVPVPANGKTGYWDADHNTCEITASEEPGSAKWHLLAVPIQSYFLRTMPLGNPLGLLDVEVYKAEWVPKQWIIRVSITKTSTTAAEFAGWIMLFREVSL